MGIKMKKMSTAVLAIMAMSGSMMANADTDRTGFYVGGEFGAVKADLDNTDDSLSGQSYGTYGGYNFNEWFGLEGTLYGTSDLGEDNVSFNLASFAITPKFTLVLNDTFSLYAKAGLSFVSARTEYSETKPSFVVTGTRVSIKTVTTKKENDHFGAGFVVGAGVNAALTEHLNLRLGYDYTSVDLDSDDFGAPDIDTDLSRFTLGMHYQF